ncbi:MAG: response regulator, partial [Bacteroidales bacterium]
HKKDGSPFHLKASIYPFPAAPRMPFQFLTVALEEQSLQDNHQPGVLTNSTTNGSRDKETDLAIPSGLNGLNPVPTNGQPNDAPTKEILSQDEKELKVLVATDAEANRLVISKYMQKLNIAFDSAYDGLSVLNKLQQSSYDLILMDMKLPVVDGPNTIKAIRRKKEAGFHRIPIIALSTSQQQDAMSKCLAAGADDWLAEPFKLEELNHKILKLVVEKRKPQHMETPQNNSSSADQQPLYNLEYLEQLSEGDHEFTSSMISYFIDNTPGVLDSMKENYEQKDWVALRNVAHKFKPQLNFMGINSVLEEVENIEQDAFKQQNLERLPTYIEKTDRICRAAIEQLKVKLEDYS